MGAPKQRWSAEEEAALKAGVHKHGPGKWQAILRDPEFVNILRLRSNVDLKDKWRNINVTLSGLGSREKVKLALKLNPQLPKLEDRFAVANNPLIDEGLAEANPLVCNETAEVLLSTYIDKTSPRLDNVIMEAITTPKEPKGSDKYSIAKYMKRKHRYMIPRSLLSSETRCSSSNSKLVDHPTSQRKKYQMFTRPEVVAECGRMNYLSDQAAACAAAQAVAEAEAAIAEAEKAAREAESAEAEAEAAQVFAEAVMNAFGCQNLLAC